MKLLCLSLVLLLCALTAALPATPPSSRPKPATSRTAPAPSSKSTVDTIYNWMSETTAYASNRSKHIMTNVYDSLSVCSGAKSKLPTPAGTRQRAVPAVKVDKVTPVKKEASVKKLEVKSIKKASAKSTTTMAVRTGHPLIIYDEDTYLKVLEFMNLAYPLWMLICSLVAVFRPSTFSSMAENPTISWQFLGRQITFDPLTYFMGVVFLSQGALLTPKDFLDMEEHVVSMFQTWIYQYPVKPMLALLIGNIFGLRLAQIDGLVLFACSPAAPIANTNALIARGNLPASMGLFAVSTAASWVLTPLLIRLFATISSEKVPVDFAQRLASLVQMQIAPTAAGVALRYYCPAITERLAYATPVLCEAFASYMASSATITVKSRVSPEIFLPVFFYQIMSIVAGYVVPRKFFGSSEGLSRSLAMQTGLQAATPAYFQGSQISSDHAASAAMAVWVMPWVGCLVATFWRYNPQPLI